MAGHEPTSTCEGYLPQHVVDAILPQVRAQEQAAEKRGTKLAAEMLDAFATQEEARAKDGKWTGTKGGGPTVTPGQHGPSKADAAASKTAAKKGEAAAKASQQANKAAASKNAASVKKAAAARVHAAKKAAAAAKKAAHVKKGAAKKGGHGHGGKGKKPKKGKAPHGGVGAAKGGGLHLAAELLDAFAGNAEALIEWFNDGADGQIDWGSPGDFEQCVEIAGQHMDDPEGFCQNRHIDATGEPAGKGAHEHSAGAVLDAFGSHVPTLRSSKRAKIAQTRKATMAGETVDAFYSEDQPRDDGGRFEGGEAKAGGGSHESGWTEGGKPAGAANVQKVLEANGIKVASDVRGSTSHRGESVGGGSFQSQGVVVKNAGGETRMSYSFGRSSSVSPEQRDRGMATLQSARDALHEKGYETREISYLKNNYEVQRPPKA